MGTTKQTVFVVKTVHPSNGQDLFRIGVGVDRNTVPYKDSMKLSVAARRFRNDICKITGTPNLLYVDCYESVSLWRFILRRPISVEYDSLPSEQTTLDELLQTPSSDPIEYFKGLGVVFDHQEQFMILRFPEAWDKILFGIEEQSFVIDILRRFRNVCPSNQYLRNAASIHQLLRRILLHMSFARSGEAIFQSFNEKASRNHLLYRLENHQGNVGIELPWLRFALQCSDTMEADAVTPLEIRITDVAQPFDHPEGRRANVFPPEAQVKKARQIFEKKQLIVGEANLDAKELKQSKIITHYILDILKYLHVSKRAGRRPIVLREDECLRRFRKAKDSFVNGKLLKPNWDKVDSLAKEFENILKNYHVSPTFGYWTQWKERGEPIIRELNNLKTGVTFPRKRHRRLPCSALENEPDEHEDDSDYEKTRKEHVTGREVQGEGDNPDDFGLLEEGLRVERDPGIGPGDESDIRDAGRNSETGTTEN